MAESFRARLRRTVNRGLHPLGLHLLRRARAFEMDDVLAGAVRRGVEIATWIDVGASDGCWSLRARPHFPHARFLLFEPLAERQCALARLAQRHGFIPVAAVAGAEPGMTELLVDPMLDGSGIAAPGAAGPTRCVPVETVDRMVTAHCLPGPYGIKLDTHGHEIAVLEGATDVLARTSLLIIEAYNFQIGPASLRFHELCAWMEAAGFRCCDLADPMRRPGDGALWQMDLAFAPSASPIFSRNDYGEA